MVPTLALLVLSLAAVAYAFPTPEVERRQTITTLSSSEVSSFKPFTFYASAAYCQPASTLAWNCGVNCQANPTFEPIASGGDGDATQFWYVGFDPTLKTIIVAHQGTNTAELLADLTDVEIGMTGLNSTLFPGVSSDVQVHSGFAEEQARTALSILAAVQSGIAKFATAQVTIVGHSLGGALALLDSVFLPLHLSDVTFRTITYGLPRVGNQEFADYVDSHADGSLTHINNEEDPIPIVPGKFLGFHHPSGEVHIQDSGAWEACPGQDNPSRLCIVGDVPNIFESNESDHDGPYDGVEMGC